MTRHYTTFEAARLLGVSLPTVVNWIKGRRIKAHRTPGGHRRIAAEDLAAFMLRQGMALPPELSGAAPERRKALVVGEPGPFREGAVRQLAAGGFAVEQASPGFPAGAAAARFEPDVLVAFPQHPDGGETLRGVQADRDLARTPVVALAPAPWARALSEAGCAAVLAPPLGEGALLRAVEEVLAAAPDLEAAAEAEVATRTGRRAGPRAGVRARSTPRSRPGRTGTPGSDTA